MSSSPDLPHIVSTKQVTIPLQIQNFPSVKCGIIYTSTSKDDSHKRRPKRCIEGFCASQSITHCVILMFTSTLSVTHNYYHSEDAFPNRKLLHKSLSCENKSVVWGWGHGSAGKSACCEIMRTSVRMPNSFIKVRHGS